MRVFERCLQSLFFLSTSIIVVLSFIVLMSPPLFARNNLSPWAVYYAADPDPESFSEYNLLVLDSGYHLPLCQLQQTGKTVLGYISLGEVATHREYFEDVKSENILLGENPFWEGSYFVDVRSSYWQKKVVTDLIPEMVEKGFDGIFLDTLDDASFLENKDPVAYKGMIASAVRIVKMLRVRFPNLKIMMNRGYHLIDEVAPFIDMLLGESVYTEYKFDTETYGFVAKTDYFQQVEMLRKAKSVNPNIGLYTLDYWNPEDTEGIREIYKIQRKNGFIPYVATIKLDQIIIEPH